MTIPTVVMTAIHVFANHDFITIAHDELGENRADAGKHCPERRA